MALARSAAALRGLLSGAGDSSGCEFSLQARAFDATGRSGPDTLTFLSRKQPNGGFWACVGASGVAEEQELGFARALGVCRPRPRGWCPRSAASPQLRCCVGAGRGACLPSTAQGGGSWKNNRHMEKLAPHFSPRPAVSAHPASRQPSLSPGLPVATVSSGCLGAHRDPGSCPPSSVPATGGLGRSTRWLFVPFPPR